MLAAEAVSFINSTVPNDPFMLIVTPMAPHSPSHPAVRHQFDYPNEMYPTGMSNPSFNEADVSDKPFYISMLPLLGQTQINKIHDRYRNRLRCMESVSDMVEDIIDALEVQDPGLANTYVFFTSDNGFHMGEHRLGQDELDTEVEDGSSTPGGKNTMYEEDIRVPLYVRGPGITPGRTVTQLLGNVDLAPTFREIAGITPVGSTVDGRSFLPLLKGQSIPWRTRYLISRGLTKPYAGIRMSNETVFAELATPALNEIRGEYYNLAPAADPYELVNTYPSLPPTQLAQLQAKVAAYQACSGNSCRVADSS